MASLVKYFPDCLSLPCALAAEVAPVSGSIISILAYSFVFGLKHVVEPDHLAAVSSIVSERKSLFSSMIVGGWWGCGQTLSLLLVGLIVILLGFDLREEHRRTSPGRIIRRAVRIAFVVRAKRRLIILAVSNTNGSNQPVNGCFCQTTVLIIFFFYLSALLL